MKKILSSVVGTLLVLFFLNSCKTKSATELIYFNNLDSVTSLAQIPLEKYEVKIQPFDELAITVNSEVPEATAYYNLPLTNPSSRIELTSQTQPKLQTYLVDKLGDIYFPVLGRIHVQGLTLTELRDLLEKEISRDVKNPYVFVSSDNLCVNVLGEVRGPGAKRMRSERYTLMEALADANDITLYGNRSNVLVIRDENGIRTFHRLNLNDANVFNSPYFILKQNDVVYVEPNKIQKDNSKYNQNNAFKLSIVSTIVSAMSVIASMVIALTIK